MSAALSIATETADSGAHWVSPALVAVALLMWLSSLALLLTQPLSYLTIYFAKINTNNNEISDVFYILDRHKKKISTNYYHFIENELITLIENLV